MSQNAFLTAIQKVTSGELTLTDLIAGAQALTRAGQIDQARQLYQVWLSFNRDNALAFIAHFNCSTLLTQAGDDAGAEIELRAALARNPDFTPAHVNLGSALERRGAAKEAVEQWKAGLERLGAITGDAIEYKITLLKQISRIFTDNSQHESAEVALLQCLDLNPEQRDVAEQYGSVRLAQCKWPILSGGSRASPKNLLARFHPLSMCAYADDPLLHLGAAHRYVNAVAAPDTVTTHSDRRDAPIELGRRLRVGYVSSDLRAHAVGYLMAQVFEEHDASAVEVFVYYCGIPASDAIAERVRAAAEHWIDIRGIDDDEAAARIAPAEKLACRAEFGFGPADIVYTCVARFAAQKAHDVLLRAFDRARKVDPRIKLLLVGDDPFGDWRQKAEAHAREWPTPVQEAAAREMDPDRRILAMLGARVRGSHVAAAPTSLAESEVSIAS